MEVFVALMEQLTWSQSELASRLGVQVPTVRRLLSELKASGVPLEREEDHPQVYWSVRRGWLPGGVILNGSEVDAALRLLARTPASTSRDALLAKLLQLTPHAPALPRNDAVQVAVGVLPVIEDAVAQRQALSFEYLSGASRARAIRVASVHRVEHGTRPRFVATCHRSGTLKRFRLEYVLAASLDAREPYRDVAPALLDAFVKRSLDGYAGDAPVPCAFVVRAPEASWVASNLPEGDFQLRTLPDGSLRIAKETGAIDVLARFVVGLGAAARAETPELARRVLKIARAGLRNAR